MSSMNIGWVEKVNFPDLGIYSIQAKIDTGAYNSSLHANNIILSEKDESTNERMVSFHYPTGFHQFIAVNTPVHDIRTVRSSNGISEKRIYIKSNLEMADKRWSIIISLSDRSRMRFPLLLGRNSLRNHVIIHPGKKYLIK